MQNRVPCCVGHFVELEHVGHVISGCCLTEVVDDVPTWIMRPVVHAATRAAAGDTGHVKRPGGIRMLPSDRRQGPRCGHNHLVRVRVVNFGTIAVSRIRINVSGQGGLIGMKLGTGNALDLRRARGVSRAALICSWSALFVGHYAGLYAASQVDPGIRVNVSSGIRTARTNAGVDRGIGYRRDAVPGPAICRSIEVDLVKLVTEIVEVAAAGKDEAVALGVEHGSGLGKESSNRAVPPAYGMCRVTRRSAHRG